MGTSPQTPAVWTEAVPDGSPSLRGWVASVFMGVTSLSVLPFLFLWPWCDRLMFLFGILCRCLELGLLGDRFF